MDTIKTIEKKLHNGYLVNATIKTFQDKYFAYVKTTNEKSETEYNTNTLHKCGKESMETLENFFNNLIVFEQLKEKYFTGLDG